MKMAMYDENGALVTQGAAPAGAAGEIIITQMVADGDFLSQITFTPPDGLGVFCELVMIAKTDADIFWDGILVQMNGDTSDSNYAQSGLDAGFDGTVSGVDANDKPGVWFPLGASGSSDVNFGGMSILRIGLPSTDGILKAFEGVVTQGYAAQTPDPGVAIQHFAAGWIPTDVITSLVIVSENGANFVPGSTFILKVTPAP